MNMGKGLFTILGVLSIIAQYLLPDVPVPKEWHGVVDKLPSCLGAIMLFLGRNAYDLNPDGSKAATALKTETTANRTTVSEVPAKEPPKS